MFQSRCNMKLFSKIHPFYFWITLRHIKRFSYDLTCYIPRKCATMFLILSTSPLNCNYTTLWNSQNFSLQQYDDVRNVTDSTRLMQSWNTQQNTDRNDLLLYEQKHRVFLPLINCFVYYTQLEASRGAHRLLPQPCHILYWRVVDSFLHYSPNAVINQV